MWKVLRVFVWVHMREGVLNMLVYAYVDVYDTVCVCGINKYACVCVCVIFVLMSILRVIIDYQKAILRVIK